MAIGAPIRAADGSLQSDMRRRDMQTIGVVAVVIEKRPAMLTTWK